MLARALGAVTPLCALSSGCTTFVEPEIPPEVRQVLDNAESYKVSKSDPFLAVEPGTVFDDIGALAGCWGTVLRQRQANLRFGLFIAYHVDAQSRTFTSSAVLALDSGRLLPFGLVNMEAGSFQVRDESHVTLTITRAWATNPASGVLEETALPQPIERVALVSLQGERMMLFEDAETPDQAPPAPERWLYRRFDCPSGE